MLLRYFCTYGAEVTSLSTSFDIFFSVLNSLKIPIYELSVNDKLCHNSQICKMEVARGNRLLHRPKWSGNGVKGGL